MEWRGAEGEGMAGDPTADRSTNTKLHICFTLNLFLLVNLLLRIIFRHNYFSSSFFLPSRLLCE